MQEVKELERKMKSFDCLKCKFRLNQATNKVPFCEIGFTQNPRTVRATQNVIENGGRVCLQHPLIHAFRRPL